MFYSEDLLSRTGPLAKVWLASNMERKLTKGNVLQQDIGRDVNEIMKTGANPMALRLTGQLLLGVVRIYSRKARYLLDDCNEALMKIKMAFRPGNVDLTTNQLSIANPAALTLEDKITMNDLLAPLPDPDQLLLTQPSFDLGANDTIIAFDDSQLLPGSIEQARHAPSEAGMLEDEDLGLEFGDELEMSIEQVRDAAPERRASEEFGDASKLLEDEDLGLQFGEDEYDPPAPVPDVSANLGDIDMPDIDDTIQINDEVPDLIHDRRDRDSLSPLSSVRSSVERDLEAQAQEEHQNQTTTFEPTEEEETIIQPHQAKKRRILQSDETTELRPRDIRALQDDRSQILKDPQYLPRDPVLLALMSMQKNGQFVSNILGDGRSLGWAPELRGILSLEVVRRSGELKRKRDSGIADVELGREESIQPQLDIEEEELDPLPQPLDDSRVNRDSPVHEIPEDDGLNPLVDDNDDFTALPDNFDETAIPLLHPADSGPVSLATKHAVHMLREQFGDEAQESAAARQKNSVLFQSIVPEKTTTRADATKMFFECLVLATKDAVKVEQKADALGGPLRIRAKRGLWGQWAETSAGGEIATQDGTQQPAAAAVET